MKSPATTELGSIGSEKVSEKLVGGVVVMTSPEDGSLETTAGPRSVKRQERQQVIGLL